MARFYGTIQGGRGQATRLGHANSGLHVTAQSYNGDVVVDLRAEGDRRDDAYIYVRGHGASGQYTLYAGDVSKLLTAEGQKAWIKKLVKSHHLRDEIVREYAEDALREQYDAGAAHD